MAEHAALLAEVREAHRLMDNAYMRLLVPCNPEEYARRDRVWRDAVMRHSTLIEAGMILIFGDLLQKREVSDE